MTSWPMIIADFILLWAAILFGLVWHVYWWERDHHHR